MDDTGGMNMKVIVRSATAQDSALDEIGDLFNDYRAHYGHPGSSEATRRWLRDQLTERRLQLAVAVVGGRGAGFITTTVVPASQTLRTFWLIRDLYVSPEHRRSGVARALLQHVIEAARADGAHRLSLQTETANTAALRLYASAGFESVTGLQLLNLKLT
ncbi:GNAT family N-acetyltransferase [Actinoallomurus sp. NPDC050550]|uniref:GNAT family N-acetyltransferase n=1 Tax=Actinoallomurus sp. NPDC050550 TaxID=3154937 RepID=UPI0033EDE921